MPVKRYIEQTDRSKFYFWDDFGAANFDDRTWGYGGAGAGSVAKIAALGGQVRVTVGGTAGNSEYLVQDTRLNCKHSLGIAMRVKVEDRTNSAHQFGLQQDGTHLIQFIADSSIGLNWLATCKNGAPQTQVDTGVAVGAGWVELMISSTASEVLFFVGSTLVATITTSIPPGNFGPIVYLYRNAGSSGTRSSLIDWVEISGARD